MKHGVLSVVKCGIISDKVYQTCLNITTFENHHEFYFFFNASKAFPLVHQSGQPIQMTVVKLKQVC